DQPGGDDVRSDRPAGALERDVPAQALDAGLGRVVRGDAAARLQPCHRADEHDAGAVGELRQRGPRHQEVAAQVHGERRVPVLRGRAGEAATTTDADVEDDTV